MRVRRAIFKPGKFDGMCWEWCRQIGEASGRIAIATFGADGSAEVWWEVP